MNMKTAIALIFSTILMGAIFSNLKAESPEDRADLLFAQIDSLRIEGRYDEALVAARELLIMVKTEDEAAPWEVDHALGMVTTLEFVVGLPADERATLNQADILKQRIEDLKAGSQYQEAADLNEEELLLRRRILGGRHAEVGFCTNNLAYYLEELGEYAAADSLYRLAISIEREARGPNHPFLVTRLNNLGILNNRLGNYEEAEALFSEALEIARISKGDESSEVALVLNSQAYLYDDLGQYDLAESTYREVLELDRNLKGDEHPDVASDMANLATLLTKKGEYSEADSLLVASLAIVRKVHEGDHRSVAIGLSNLADLRIETGGYDEALAFYEEALAMMQRIYGGDHPIVAQALGNLGAASQKMGNYSRADSLLNLSLDIKRHVFGEDHFQVAIGQNNLGACYKEIGDLEKAEYCLREALRIGITVLGADNPSISILTGNLASVLHARGNFAASAPLYREALARNRTHLGEDHPSVASDLSNLATLLQDQGDLAGADLLYREALAMRRARLGEDKIGLANVLGNLGSLLRDMGDLESAEPMLVESLEIDREALGESHPNVAMDLNELAMLLRNKGDLVEAEKLHREALAIRKENFGSHHTSIASSLNNLAQIYEDRGSYAEAESLLTEALEVNIASLGDEHPEIVSMLVNLASVQHELGRHELEMNNLLKASEVFEVARLRAGAGTARSSFLTSPYPKLAGSFLEQGLETKAWEAFERSQGRSLFDLLHSAEVRPLNDSEIAREDSLRLNVATCEGQYEFYRETAQVDPSEIMMEYVEESRTRMLSAHADWDAFQLELTDRYPIAGGQAFPLEKVQESLAANAAIVGWLDVQPGNNDYTSWGFVVRDEGPVRWFRLPAGDGLTQDSPFKATRALREELTQPTFGDDTSIGTRQMLYAERIAPLASSLEDVTDLIVIPSGAMLGIPVESLMDLNGKYLGDSFPVTYVPSSTIHAWLVERQIIESKLEAEGHPALLVGDPPFSPSQLAAMDVKSDGTSPGMSVEVSLLRGALAGNQESLASLPRLPATRREVTAIAGLMDQSTVLVGTEASEQEIVAMAMDGGLSHFSFLHLATHALVDDQRPGNSSLVLSRVNLPDPLEAAQSGSRIFDGLLTANEIMREWELEADLVTLSACETGLGQEVQGEGYIGFSHAFLQAGARSLLVSLWPVDDSATLLLMERFYKNLMGDGGKIGSKAAALREAKIWLRNFSDNNDNRPYEHPYYWSSFILIGDPGY